MKFYLPNELISIMKDLRSEHSQSDIEKANLIHANKTEGLPADETVLTATPGYEREIKPLNWFYTPEARTEYEKPDDILKFWLFYDFLRAYSYEKEALKHLVKKRENSLMRLACAFVWLAHLKIYGGYESVIDPKINPLIDASLKLKDKERLENFEICMPKMSDGLVSFLESDNLSEQTSVYMNDASIRVELDIRESMRGDRDVFNLLYAFTDNDFWLGYDKNASDYPLISLTSLTASDEGQQNIAVIPKKNKFPVNGREHQLERLISARKSDSPNILTAMSWVTQPSDALLVPIALDDHQHFICIRFSDNAYSIVFINFETEESSLLSDTLTDFFNTFN